MSVRARQSGVPSKTRQSHSAEPAHHSGAWLGRLWISIAQRGRRFASIPPSTINPLERAKLLATELLSARGEASGAAVSQELLEVVDGLSPEKRRQFLIYLAEGFQADAPALADAALAYLADPTPSSAARLAAASEPPRQELLRRMNMANGGTRTLVSMRKDIPPLLRGHPALGALDADMRHLFVSWFNRGFLDLRQIDWHTPAAILEKLIAYEAVHEIQGWDDLRRRLAPDRRCFAFFHPALPGEPLIFVEVALVEGLAGSVMELLDRDIDEKIQRRRAANADTAIFYSISNCQDGLRGISFGNFLIKQVVEILRMELPGLKRFATLSPVPRFRRWLDLQLETGALPDIKLSVDEARTLSDMAQALGKTGDFSATIRTILSSGRWDRVDLASQAVKPVLLKLCAIYLTRGGNSRDPIDPVARFHLGNGARLERLNWMANPGSRGLRESWGIMANYLYDPENIESHHERFTRAGEIARSREVDRLLGGPSPQRRLWSR